MDACGRLYIVATPIGNLEDITFRAIRILKEVSLICAEDTRNTIKLLNHFNIKNKMMAYHKNNRYEKIPEIIEILKSGKDVAVVSDAGTPLISDPGFEIVEACYTEGIVVNSIPGACAAICALTLSALDTTSFLFQGFLPENNKQCKELLGNLKYEKRTMIFYIAPHKLIKNLEELIEFFGENRPASISRELTKIHEETIHLNLGEMKKYFTDNNIKGEFVLVLKGSESENVLPPVDAYNLNIKQYFSKLIEEGLSEKEAMKKIAKEYNIDKREVYREIKIEKE